MLLVLFLHFHLSRSVNGSVKTTKLKLLDQADLDDLGPLVVDLSVGGGEEREQQQWDGNLQDPGPGGGVAQPVDQADGGPGRDQPDDARHPPVIGGWTLKVLQKLSVISNTSVTKQDFLQILIF